MALPARRILRGKEQGRGGNMTMETILLRQPTMAFGLTSPKQAHKTPKKP